MGRYIESQSDIFSIFNSSMWKAEGIKTYPENFISTSLDTEFLRISIIPNSEGINAKSISGILIIDIFTVAGNGPKRAFTIADKLDDFLVQRSILTTQVFITQFGLSTISPKGVDKDRPSLYRVSYTIPFNYFGVL